MSPILFPHYADAIRDLDLAAIDSPAAMPERFLLEREGKFSVHYIPFEYVNPAARIVVVGIAPGFAQWRNAMREAQRRIRAGAGQDEVLRAARLAGAFSGAIRPNFVALLDAIGVQRWLGIASHAQTPARTGASSKVKRIPPLRPWDTCQAAGSKNPRC